MTMARRFYNVLLLCCCLFMAACVPNTGIREEFQQSTKNFNKMLRWHEIENAGMAYMEPQQRDAFLKSAESVRRRGITITDYRILTTECLPDKGTGSVIAEFDYYILPSNRIKTLTYKQEWSYSEVDKNKSWRLKNGLPPFE